MSLKDTIESAQSLADRIADNKDDYKEMLDKTAPIIERVQGLFKKLQSGEKVDVVTELTGFPDVDATLKAAAEVDQIVASAGPGAKEILQTVLEVGRIAVAVAAIF